MKRWLVLMLIAIGSMAILAVAGRAPDVYACSVGPDFDLVEDSELIVAGRFTGWELDADWRGTQVYEPEETGGLVFAYAGIRAKMLVDRVYKGTASAEIMVTSGSTVDVYDHEPEYVWVGPSGACGAFGADPTGMYAVMGLTREADGIYGAFIFSWFYFAEDPPSNYDDRSLSRLNSLLPGYSPGSVPAGPDVFWPAVILAVVSPLVFVGATLVLAWRISGRMRSR